MEWRWLLYRSKHCYILTQRFILTRIKVFGRKFEKELEALRKELATMATGRDAISTPASGIRQSESSTEDDGEVLANRVKIEKSQ